MIRLLPVALLFLLLSGCASNQTVLRRRDSRLEEGRKVPKVAYAWYARGVFLREQGQVSDALYCFERAAESDPKSGAAWAAMAALQCAGRSSEANHTFELGFQRATELAPLYAARVRCLLDGELPDGAPQALADAKALLSVDPDWPTASLLLEQALRANHQDDAAARVSRAARLYFREVESDSEVQSPVAAIDRALMSGDLEQAQRLSSTALRPGQLAIRAVALGKPTLAKEQATLSLGAEPEEANSLVALLIIGEQPPLLWPSDSPHPGAGMLDRLSPLALCLLSEHLSRELGSTAQALFVRQLRAPGAEAADAGDPLLRECWQRQE